MITNIDRLTLFRLSISKDIVTFFKQNFSHAYVFSLQLSLFLVERVSISCL